MKAKHFRARSSLAFATATAGDTPGCASSISGLFTVINASTSSISSVGIVSIASTTLWPIVWHNTLTDGPTSESWRKLFLLGIRRVLRALHW